MGDFVIAEAKDFWPRVVLRLGGPLEDDGLVRLTVNEKESVLLSIPEVRSLQDALAVYLKREPAPV